MYVAFRPYCLHRFGTYHQDLTHATLLQCKICIVRLLCAGLYYRLLFSAEIEGVGKGGEVLWSPTGILFSVHQGLFPRSGLTQSQSNFKPALLQSAQGQFTYKWLFKAKAHNNVVPRKTVNYCFVKYHPSRCGSQNDYIQGGFLSVQLTQCLTCFRIHDATERKYLTMLSNLKLCSTRGKRIECVYGA